jgi:hypothetical protein
MQATQRVVQTHWLILWLVRSSSTLCGIFYSPLKVPDHPQEANLAAFPVIGTPDRPSYYAGAGREAYIKRCPGTTSELSTVVIEHEEKSSRERS